MTVPQHVIGILSTAVTLYLWYLAETNPRIGDYWWIIVLVSLVPGWTAWQYLNHLVGRRFR